MPVGRRIAVVLFNLGGPDSPAAVEPFLLNLFSDPAIIGLPWPLRPLLARVIARRRAATARGIYAKIGGRSPILPNTEAQAAALAEQLHDLGEVRLFCCMRYWHPMSDEVAAAVQSFSPDEIVLLPLYPQFSSTTTASSQRSWMTAAVAIGLAVPTKLVCCYPTEPGFVAAAAALVRAGIAESEAKLGRPPRVLFSAHGLPKKIVSRGDPYPSQVAQSARAIAVALGLADADWTVCYQSRVGPLEWIGPATDAEIRRAGAEKKGLIVVPVAFVSEHSETLVELDIEYGVRLAGEVGVPHFIRVPTVRTHPAFIGALATLVTTALGAKTPVTCAPGRICPVACTCGHERKLAHV